MHALCQMIHTRMLPIQRSILCCFCNSGAANLCQLHPQDMAHPLAPARSSIRRNHTTRGPALRHCPPNWHI